MSVEQEDQLQEFSANFLKYRIQDTSICNHQKGPSESNLELELQTSLDCSFERTIHQDNIEILRSATTRYLQESLLGDFDRAKGFRDDRLYENLPFEAGGNRELEMLTVQNVLLTHREQQELVGLLQQQEELLRFARETLPVFGITVGRELLFAIYHLLKLKLKAFRKLRYPKEGLLPRFDCFQGFEDEETAFNTACPLYQQLSLQEIGAQAEKDLQEVSSTLYFSHQIKYLNLREVKLDTRGNIFQRFNSLIRQLSRTIFFTLAGAIEPATLSASFLDLSREVSFSELSEGTLGVRRSMSRPSVPYDEEQLDFLNKKRKFE